jgi:hypothetical protein
MSQLTKQIIIAVIIIIVAFVGFKMFFPGSGSGEASLVTEQSTATFAEGQTILNLLNKLNEVTIDDSVFSNPIFVSLVSFEIPIQDQVVGRPNPFLPIGVNNPGLIVPVSTSTIRR